MKIDIGAGARRFAPIGRQDAAMALLRAAGRRLSLCLLFLLCLSQPQALAQEAADEVLTSAGAEVAPDTAAGLTPEIEAWIGDLDGMRERRRIRILVPFSKTFYFIDRGGAQYGMTYEVGKAFEEWINKKYKTKSLRIEVVFIPVSRDRLLPGLLDGTGDAAAANLTITPERAALVDFAKPVATNVREVVVTGPAAPPLTAIEDLAGKEVHARQSSSYFEHLKNLSGTFEAAGRPAIVLMPIDEDLEDEDILEMVNAGLLPWAVVDEHKAKLWAEIFTATSVRSDLAVNEGGEIAWALRKDSPLLRADVDEFFAKHKMGTTFGNMLKKKYLGDVKYAKRATSDEDLQKFKELIVFFEKYGAEYGFDELMIAAQGYQESGLDQSARSHRGAVGIMQLMPSTAADPSVGIADIDKSAENNVHAGVKYLRLLIDKYLDDPALDEKNRMLMAFAAYNAGPGNLRKFRRLAQQSGLDPNVWFQNVEHAAAKVVGREPLQYVSNIYKYYVAYSLVRERAAERAAAKEGVTTSPAKEGVTTSP